MDPITIALAALNLGGAGYNYYNQQRLGQAQTSLANAQGQAQLTAARNAQSQYQDDLTRRRRMLEEGLAARGVGESTIARDDMNYLNAGAARDLQNLQNNVGLANRNLSFIRQQANSRRRGNYLNLGLGIANSLGGAYSAFKGAPTTGGGYGDLPFVSHA